ncbi:tail tape measure protein [Sphingomonas sp. IC-11]|uniref:tail tape measure protein n=1 Tax=Sphingomonas sp. IC-11 TaxID=2898528 RepID=UPI001E63613B|nr:tail tape measure protein [Sphingomonas sp. IC-11]MCD2317652.1 tail tape measure protein [Sphingomonas sp. IC-11]
MDEDWDRMVVGVRADAAGFARDVAEMRAALEGPLAAGADRAGRAIETTLARAVRTGKLGFEDLKSVALSAMGEIAAQALRSGIGSVVGIGGAPGGGLASVLLAALGAPGRATGGPVSPGRPFWVGERGPELFVPTAAGSVLPTPGQPAGGGRDVRVSIAINAAPDAAPAALARSSRQVARAVKAALADMED